MKFNYKFIFIISFIFIIFSCASQKPKQKEIPKPEVIEVPKSPSEVEIPPVSQPPSESSKPDIPEKEAVMPIAPIILDAPDKAALEDRLLNAALIKNLEIGSPRSLRLAVEHIKLDTKGLTDTNRLYLVIIAELMGRLYPNEKINWVVPSYQADNKYLSAFKSIDRGVYPLELNTDTFLELVIPTLYALDNKITEKEQEDILFRLKKAGELVPDSVIPPLMSGVLYEKIDSLELAKNNFNKAWNLDNSCLMARLKYGFLLAKTGSGTEALSISKELEPKMADTEVHKLLYAESYVVLKDYDSATPYIVDILSRNPENTNALLLRIEILIERQEYLKANTLLELVGGKNKTDKDYLLLSASIKKLWSKNFVAATRILAEAYQLYPSSFEVLLACAEICFETGQKIQGKSGREFIDLVLEKDSNNAKALVLIIQNDISVGNWSIALKRAEQLVTNYPSKENSFLLGRVYLGANKNAQALSVFEKLYTESENPSNDLTELYLEALVQNSQFSKVRAVIDEKSESQEANLMSILYYYKAVLSDEYNKLSLYRSSLLSNPRNKRALFAMYEWYYRINDFSKAEYYLKQVIAIDPANQQNIKLLENLKNK